MSWFDDFVNGVGDVFSDVGDAVGSAFDYATDWGSGAGSNWDSAFGGDLGMMYDAASSTLGGDPSSDAVYMLGSPDQAANWYGAFGGDYGDALNTMAATAGLSTEQPGFFDRLDEAAGSMDKWARKHEKGLGLGLKTASMLGDWLAGRQTSPLEKMQMEMLKAQQARSKRWNSPINAQTVKRQFLNPQITAQYGRSAQPGTARFYDKNNANELVNIIRQKAGGRVGRVGRPPLMTYAGGGQLFRGTTGGQDDVVPILGSHGEYMIDASTVSDLGDGNTEAGADRLDRMVERVRQHKRGRKSLPPPAKAPEEYL